jgi:hypothetical protein
VALSSCKKTLPDVGGTAAQKMANEWWVTLKLNGADQYGTHVKIKTSNTAANDDSLWVDDYPAGTSGNVWGFQVKTKADYNALTFSTPAAGTKSAVAAYPITVTITNGQVFPKMGHSRSGVIVDSIHMKIKFSDDPANTYDISGQERTRLIEDDY